MEDEKLIKILNALAGRYMLLECQVLALRRMLDKNGMVNDLEFESMLAKTVATYKESLSSRKDGYELLAEFLRKFEGPIQ